MENDELIGKMVSVFVPVIREGESGDPYGMWEMVAGEPTPVPGLVVTPELSPCGERYTGGWRITHAGSGGSVGPTFHCPKVASASATRLATLGVAWASLRWPLGSADEPLIAAALAKSDQPAA
jgi:hypothetical protein